MIFLDAGETMQRLESAVGEARIFFGIDPIWETPIVANHLDGAQIGLDPAYLRAPIRVDLDFFQRNPDMIREYMGHEIAHLMSVELSTIRDVLPPEWRDESTPAGQMMNTAVERLTVRLEKLFLRERPEPGDGYSRPTSVAFRRTLEGLNSPT